MRKAFLGGLLLLASCNSSQPAADAPAADDAPAAQPSQAATPSAGGLQRGMLRIHAPVSFRVCGTDNTLPVSDPRGELNKVPRDLVTDTAGVLFAIVLGARGDSLRVDRLLYAMTEGYECYTDWGGFDARALGNEPGWVVEARGGTLAMQRQGGAAYEWVNARRDSSANEIRYRAEHAQHGVIELTFTDRVCRDAMSGAFYAWTARAQLNRERLDGCGFVAHD